MTAERPVSVLIAAMGGEGGGVLAGWLIKAAEHAGLTVQATSIPGVAQRTGATTYYVEIWPEPLAGEGVAEPLFALYPTPGEIDVMVASELIEAGRAVANGYVAPERTALIASTHRVYAIGERTAMGDGRFDGDSALAAARRFARRAVLADFAAAAKGCGSAVNAVMLGAVAGLGELPMAEADFRAAVRDSGVAVEASLAGFAAGLALAAGETAPASADEAPAAEAPGRLPRALEATVAAIEPPGVRAIAGEGARRLAGYQGQSYAARYLARLARVGAIDERTATETAKVLALRMAYEDVIRVAQLKSRRERLARVRAEMGAEGRPLHVIEYLKPGIEELCALLPGALARPLLRWAARRGLTDRLNFALKVRSTSLSGYLMLRLLAGLRPLRPMGHRFAEEQAWIDAWLEDIRAAPDAALAYQIAASARLIKGYGETFRRGMASFATIRESIVAPALAAAVPGAAEHLRRAREAALADPEGDALAAVLAETGERAEAAE